MSCDSLHQFGLGLALGLIADVRPINIRAELLASHRSLAFPFDVYAKRLAKLLAHGACFAEIANSRSTAGSKSRLLIGRHAFEVSDD